MAADETFEWFVATMMKHPSPEIVRIVKDARATLQNLRSEDERQRYVDSVVEGFRPKRRPPP